jgi:hypothetical protein
MPVSATASSTPSRPSAATRTRRVTSPSFVNLQALLSKLSKICLSRMGSAVSTPTFSRASTMRRKARQIDRFDIELKLPGFDLREIAMLFPQQRHL